MATIDGHHSLGIEPRAAGIDLERKRAAGEQRGHPDDGKGQPADLDKLLQEFAEIEGRAQDVRGDGAGEQRNAACCGQRALHGAAKSGEGRQDKGHPG